MTEKQKIQKIAAGRMTVEVSRKQAGKKQFVKLFANHVKEKQRDAARAAVLSDLVAAGYPAETGHYGNEISFFLPAS